MEPQPPNPPSRLEGSGFMDSWRDLAEVVATRGVGCHCQLCSGPQPKEAVERAPSSHGVKAQTPDGGVAASCKGQRQVCRNKARGLATPGPSSVRQPPTHTIDRLTTNHLIAEGPCGIALDCLAQLARLLEMKKDRQTCPAREEAGCTCVERAGAAG